MTKEAFIALLTERMQSMNIPPKNTEQHLSVLTKCIEFKTPEQIDETIESLGGLETILRGIYDLELKKYEIYKKRTEETEIKKQKETYEPEIDKKIENIIDIDVFEQGQIEEENKISDEAAVFSENQETKVMNKEEINENINKKLMEFAAENGYLTGEITIESKFDAFLKKKSSEFILKNNKILLLSADFILYPFYSFIYILYSVIISLLAVLFILFAVTGTVFLISEVIYGLFNFEIALPSTLYEIGLGITVFSANLIMSVLAYNGMKRLMPYLFKINTKSLYELNGINRKMLSDKAVKK